MLLEELPQGAIILREGRIVCYNNKMPALLLALDVSVTLECGAELPLVLDGFLQQMDGDEGTFLRNGRQYTLRRRTEETEVMILLEEMVEVLSQRTLDEFLYRFRENMHQAGLGIQGLEGADELARVKKIGEVQRAYYGMVRVLEHIDLLRGDGVVAPPCQMELVSYCQRLEMEIAPLMEVTGTQIQVVPKHYNLNVEGEEHILQRLILGLVANAVQRGGTEVTIQLSQSGERCKIALWDNSAPGEEKEWHRQLLTAPDSLDIATTRALAKRLGGLCWWG